LIYAANIRKKSTKRANLHIFATFKRANLHISKISNAQNYISAFVSSILKQNDYLLHLDFQDNDLCL